MYYFTNTKSSRSHARDTDSFVVPGDFCIAFVLPLRATRITRPRIGQWSDPQAALVANHSLWGNHRKPLDTILELHDLASFPHWTGSRRMSLNNFKLLEDHCKSLSGPFLWKHILPTHTHTHTHPPFISFPTCFWLALLANRALTSGGFQTLRFGDLQLDPNITAVNLPTLFVAVCCGVGLAAGICLRAELDIWNAVVESVLL